MLMLMCFWGPLPLSIPRSTKILAPRARVDGDRPELELELPAPSKRDLGFEFWVGLEGSFKGLLLGDL